MVQCSGFEITKNQSTIQDEVNKLLEKGVVECEHEPVAVQSIAKKSNLKQLPEITIFLWNAVLGNIYTAIAENSNIYFFFKSTHFFNKITAHMGG